MPRLLTVVSTAALVALPVAAAPSAAVAATRQPSAQAAQARRGRPNGKPIRNGRVGVDTISDRPDVNPGDGICRDRKGRCSLRAAIDEANARDGGLRISLQANRKFTLRQQGAGEDANASGDLDIRRPVTIVGRNAIINANRIDRAFHIHRGARLTIGKTRIANGAPPAGQGGGAFLNEGRLVIKGGKTIKNAVSGDAANGGAILNLGGTVVLRDTRVNRNTATGSGGALHAVGGTTQLRRTQVAVNRAGLGGGLAFGGAARVDGRSATIDRNAATVSGGGVWLSREANAGFFDSKVTRNTAAGVDAGQGGGGFYAAGGQLRVDRGAIGGNAASGSNGAGGGVYNAGATVLLFGVELRSNVARLGGGAVAATAGQTSFGRATVTANMATDGAGLHQTGTAVADVADTTLLNNRASGSGGGVWSAAPARAIVRDSVLQGNSAAGDAAGQGGGAIFAQGDGVTVERGVIAGNSAAGAAGDGGGVLAVRGRVEVIGAELRTNAARAAGGAVAVHDGTAVLAGVRLLDNTAADGAGASLAGGALELRDAEVLRNVAAASGGGVRNHGGTVAIARTAFVANRAAGAADGQGGGALFNAGELTVEGGRYVDNQASGARGVGGALLNADRATATIAGAELRANAATTAGGGIWAAATATTTVTGATIEGNAAPLGADLFNQPPGGRFTVDGRPVDPTEPPRS